jgi:hypothetical protein
MKLHPVDVLVNTDDMLLNADDMKLNAIDMKLNAIDMKLNAIDMKLTIENVKVTAGDLKVHLDGVKLTIVGVPRAGAQRRHAPRSRSSNRFEFLATVEHSDFSSDYCQRLVVVSGEVVNSGDVPHGQRAVEEIGQLLPDAS